MKSISGIIVPILTPMNPDETINEAELKNQVERMIRAGVHGIFAYGTNGEGYILDDREKEQVLSIIVETAAGRVPVYAGTGCISTRDTIRLSKMAERVGADVLSVITPSFAQASQEELYEHYRTLAENVSLPIVLYNIPMRTGNALAPVTVARLAEIDNIVGAKDSSGNFDNMLQYIEQTRGKDFAILAGNDGLILWNLIAGGQGAIAGCANVIPENMTAIYERFQAGDLDGARQAQDRVRPLRALFKYGNSNTIIKRVVAEMGYPVGECRRPFHQVSEEGVQAIRRYLETLK